MLRCFNVVLLRHKIWFGYGCLNSNSSTKYTCDIIKVSFSFLSIILMIYRYDSKKMNIKSKLNSTENSITSWVYSILIIFYLWVLKVSEIIFKKKTKWIKNINVKISIEYSTNKKPWIIDELNEIEWNIFSNWKLFLALRKKTHKLYILHVCQ